MNITLALTTYKRTGLLFEAIEQVLNDDRVSEIVIVDDASPDDIFQTIAWKYNGVEKVKLFRNPVNLDCYKNKREAVSKSSSEWVILFDSDNIMTKAYIDRIENLFVAGLNSNTIYQPSFAKPHFNFTQFEGLLINKSNVGKHMVNANFSTMLNAMNYFVNRDEYLRVWDGSIDPVTSDSIYHNLNWLKAGNNIYVVPDLNYEHRVHNGSHYQNNVQRTERGLHQKIEQELKQMA